MEAAHGTPLGPCLSGPAAQLRHHVLELPCPHHAKKGDDADADALQLRAAGVDRIGLCNRGLSTLGGTCISTHKRKQLNKLLQ